MYRFDPSISSAIKSDQPAPALGPVPGGPLTAPLLDRMQRYWQAANYLTVGQIYLQDNPLLREPLRPEHIKPRLLGHWGTSPGLSFIYVHLNRLITEHDVDVHLSWPGPATAARRSSPTSISRAPIPRSTRTSRRTWPACGGSSASSPRPAASRATSACTTPGSIHEGGELGYVLAHAFGAAFDNPDLIVACGRRRRRGRDRAAGGLLEGHQLPQSRARRRRAARSCISTATRSAARPCWARVSDERRCASCSRAHGYEVHFRRGRRPARVHQAASPRRSTQLLCARSAPSSERRPRARRRRERPRWPAIVLRTPKGWTGPKVVDGAAGRGHVPRAPGAARRTCATDPEHLAQLEAVDAQLSSRKRSSTSTGSLIAGAGRARARGRPPHGRQPPRQRRQAARRTSTCPTSATTPSTCRSRRTTAASSRRASSASCCATSSSRNKTAGQLPAVLPGRDQLQPPGRRLRGREPLLRRPDPRHRRPRVARRPGDGGAERAPLRGLARGLSADRTPRPVRHLRGVRHGVGVDDRAAHQVAGGGDAPALARRRSPRSTSC